MATEDPGSLDIELAKAAGTTVVESARDVRKAISLVFGDATRQLAQALSDKAEAFKLRNRIQIILKMRDYLRKQRIKEDALKELSFGDRIRVMDAASLEETDEVQDLWARLIGNAISGKNHNTINKSHIDLLKSMTPIEAAFLDLLYKCEIRNNFRTVEEVREFNNDMNVEAKKKWRKYGDGDRRSAIHNLVRMRCVTFRPHPIQHGTIFSRLPMEMDRSQNWAVVDPKEFQRVIEQIMERIAVSSGVQEFNRAGDIELSGGYMFRREKISVPEMNYMLTPLGTDLMGACSPRPKARRRKSGRDAAGNRRRSSQKSESD